MDNNKDFQTEVLDQYFKFRSNLPQAGHIAEWKTTQDIQDDLSVIDSVPLSVINKYMTEHGYELATANDGTLAWAIWGNSSRWGCND